MNYRAILFDFDGTLADSREDVWLSLEYGAKQAGGMLSPTFRADSANLAYTEQEIFAFLRPSLPPERMETFCAAVRHHYRTINTFPNTRMYPGMLQLLEHCQKYALPCHIVTNKPAQPMKKILREKGWSALFETVLSPDSLPGEPRPKAELIRYLLNEGLGHRDAIYVGDTGSDVIACRENEIDCIGVLYGDGDPMELRAQNPAYLANTVDDVSRILFGEDSGQLMPEQGGSYAEGF